MIETTCMLVRFNEQWVTALKAIWVGVGLYKKNKETWLLAMLEQWNLPFHVNEYSRNDTNIYY